MGFLSVPALVNGMNGMNGLNALSICKDMGRILSEQHSMSLSLLSNNMAELKTTANVGVKVPLAHSDSLCCTPTGENILRVLRRFLLSRA